MQRFRMVGRETQRPAIGLLGFSETPCLLVGFAFIEPCIERSAVRSMADSLLSFPSSPVCAIHDRRQPIRNSIGASKEADFRPLPGYTLAHSESAMVQGLGRKQKGEPTK